MTFITQTIGQRKVNVMQIIKDASQDWLKANPDMTIRESFESCVQPELNFARHVRSIRAEESEER